MGRVSPIGGRTSPIRAAGRHLVVAVLVGAVAAACTTTPVTTPPSPQPAPTGPTLTGGGTLRVALADDPRSIDPRFVTDEEGELIVGQVFEPLVRLDASGELVPGAASDWVRDEDGRTFTFTLREASFHDGAPVTAVDVKRTFDRIADETAEPPSPLDYLVEPIAGFAQARSGAGLDGVEVVDERTVKITLASPDPRFLFTLADPSLVPTPPQADQDPLAFGQQPVGNGPFQVAEPPEPGAFIRLTRVADHHRTAHLEEVVFQIYPDDPTRERQWREFSEGLVHVADLGADRAGTALRTYGRGVDGQQGPGVLDAPTATITLLAFRMDAAPFNEPVVRRAISQAIDRDAIATTALRGTAIPADTIVPAVIPGSASGTCDHCRYDPIGAAALVDDAEVTLPPTLTLVTNRGGNHRAVADRVAADVGVALGVEVAVETRDLREFVPALHDGEIAWFRLGWSPNEPDPGAYLVPLFMAGSRDNLTGFADDEVEELLGRARAAPDGEARALYAEVERRLLEEVAVIPLVVHRRMKVVAPEVRGLVWLPTGRVDLARVRLARVADSDR